MNMCFRIPTPITMRRILANVVEITRTHYDVQTISGLFKVVNNRPDYKRQPVIATGRVPVFVHVVDLFLLK